MMTPFVYTRRVAFHETDAAGIVHFANFFKFAAEAETRALDSLGVLVFPAPYYWPRVHVEADYRRPLHFNDELKITAALTRIGRSSLHWVYEIVSGGHLCAVVRAVSVRTDHDNVPVAYSEEERAVFSSLLREHAAG